MKKQTISAAILTMAFALGIAAPVRADITQTLNISVNNGGVPPALGGPNYYDSPNGYDFSSLSNYPPTTDQYIGSFEFAIPTGEVVTGILIQGTFGNPDSPTTSLADFFLGDGADGETAVDVANCDNVLENCYAGGGSPDGPDGSYSWSYTLTAADLGNLTNAFTSGTLDFSYEWVNNAGIDATGVAGQPQYVFADAPQIDILVSPEPGTILICLGGLAGIAALRRFRRV